MFVPSVTAPANITTEATAALTAVNLGAAVVVDPDEPLLTATPDLTGPFAVGVHQVTWTATDNNGHQGFDNQTVTITDTTAPEITLNGASTIEIIVGGNYTELNAIAADLVDGDISNNIIISGTVNTNVIAQYEVRYNVSDTAGNPATEVVRTIDVVADDLIFNNGFE